MKKRIFLSVFLLLLTCALRAQTLSGTVVDGNGEPVIGAAVKVVGTTTGTVTDFDGHFALEAADNAEII